MKAQQSSREILTAPGESGEETTVLLDLDAAHGPTDALLAEIAFILAESQTRKTSVLVD